MSTIQQRRRNMNRLAILIAALLAALPVLANHGSDLFRTSLSGYEEVPPVSTAARGEFQARVSRDGQSIDYELAYDRLQGQVRQAHVHFAQMSVNGPIVIWLCGTATNPGPAGTQTCPQSGTVRGTLTAADVLASPTTQQLAAGEIAELIAALRSDTGYVNVHTDISPGGEIRGQIGGRGRGCDG
jgi:hypothetical protein